MGEHDRTSLTAWADCARCQGQGVVVVWRSHGQLVIGQKRRQFRARELCQCVAARDLTRGEDGNG